MYRKPSFKDSRYEEPEFEELEFQEPRFNKEPMYDQLKYEEPNFVEEQRYEKPRFEQSEQRFEKPRYEPSEQRYEKSRYEELDYENPRYYEEETSEFQEFQEEPVTSRYYQPEVLQPKGEVPDLPQRPHPEEFHNKVEDQLDFSTNTPKSLPITPSTVEPFYEDEALGTPTPVYVPKTTYKFENDYQQELPVRPEVLPDPNPVRNTRNSFYADEPDYYRYNPMDYAEPKEPKMISDEDFPQIQPFDEIDREFSTRSLDIPRSPKSRSGSGRALGFTPEPFYPEPRNPEPRHPEPAFHEPRFYQPRSVEPEAQLDANRISEPYQFTHVDAPHTFRAGHSRGNHYHNIQDIEEHEGPHHLQEVRFFQKFWFLQNVGAG